MLPLPMSKNELPPSRRGWFYPFTRRWLLTATVWSIVVLVAASWLLYRPTVESLEQHWKAQAGFDPLIAYPKREINDAARRIEELVAPLGIEIAPQGVAGRARVSKQQAAKLREVREELDSFLRGLRQTEPVLSPPPPGLETFLTESEPTLMEVSRQLREGEVPLWDQDVNAGIRKVLPNFLGHLWLQKFLVAMTAEAARRGEREQSLEWLEASWRLSQSLGGDPAMIPQLIFLAEMRANLAVLRAIDLPLGDWHHRLSIGPWCKGMEAAFRLESWSFIRGLRLGQFEEDSNGGVISNLLIRLRTRHGAKGLMDLNDRLFERVKSENILEMDYDGVFEEEEAKIPRWNILARMFVPNYFDALAKPARLALSTDLTRRILEMRSLLRAGDLEAIADLQGSHPSVRKGVSWVYQIEGDKITIRVDGHVPDLVDKKIGKPLPVEISLSRSSDLVEADGVSAPDLAR
ncbi:MAG: hypothetical protein K0U98_12685 [Deltaproteobacteria bacterium]|nr:hypothetical protein [Deltaproteobacteria bacterium]